MSQQPSHLLYYYEKMLFLYQERYHKSISVLLLVSRFQIWLQWEAHADVWGSVPKTIPICLDWCYVDTLRALWQKTDAVTEGSVAVSHLGGFENQNMFSTEPCSSPMDTILLCGLATPALISVHTISPLEKLNVKKMPAKSVNGKNLSQSLLSLNFICGSTQCQSILLSNSNRNWNLSPCLMRF